MLARQRLLTRFPAKPGGCDFSISGPGDVGHRSGTGRSGGYDDPMTAALAEASGKTPAPPSTPSNKNISLFRISDLWHISAILVPARGALRDRHEMRAGVAVDAVAPARSADDRAGNRESSATRHDTARSQRVRRPSGASTREPRVIRRDRPRTEKSCGSDARKAGVKPSGDAAARPGTCIIEPQGDGGKSASLPEESTKDTVKTIRAGKAGRPAYLSSTPVRVFEHTRDFGCQPAPGLPCALSSERV